MNVRPIAVLALGLASVSFAEERKPLASFIELPWSYVIGGWSNGRWLNSEVTGKRLTAPRTSYRVFNLNGTAGEVFAAAAAPDMDVCPDVWLQKITPQPDLEKKAIGVNAAWDPMPRKAKSADTTQDLYVDAVRELLKAKGIADPKVKITQLLRIDLEGDKEDEVILSATNYSNAGEVIAPKAGDYSFVALRRLVKGKVQTQIIGGDFYTKVDENSAPDTYKIAGFLDLNGDGKLEVIIHTTYYEGGGIQVWQLQNEKLVRVLRVDCGA